MPVETTKVLIVGAGPTGLALACRLARDGVDFILVDRQAEGANTSRAAVIHARTLEVLEEVGVSDDLVRRGLTLRRFSMSEPGHELVHVAFDDLPTRYPFVLMLAQWETEQVLLARLKQLGGDVRRPLEVSGLEITAGGADARVTSETGELRIHADYVVGADGMHSTVRGLAEIGFSGGEYPESFVLADVRVGGELDTEEVSLMVSPEGLMVIAPLPHDRVRLVATVDPAPEHPDLAFVQDVLDRRGPVAGLKAADLTWASRFRVHHRLADAFRQGPILLAGDAAHVHSPAGGQGMNIGIRDAVELGGALAQVLNGRSDTGPLDAWAARRRSVARKVVRQTDLMTRAGTATGILPRFARNLALEGVNHLPAVKRAFAFQTAGLDERDGDGQAE